MIRWARRAAVTALLGFGAWQGAQGFYIEAKARLAQYLVLRAWHAARAGASHPRPWPWADTEPLARLVVPGEDVELIVLAGASGRTLAFGPGHLTGTPLPGEDGNAVLSGHRDTHFSFLARLKPGDELAVERRDGQWRRYVVSGAEVVDQGQVGLLRDTGDTRLTLVTCYPFAALRPGGPLRYVVTALLGGRERNGGILPDGLGKQGLQRSVAEESGFRALFSDGTRPSRPRPAP